MPIGYLAKVVGWDVYMKLPKIRRHPTRHIAPQIPTKLFNIAHRRMTRLQPFCCQHFGLCETARWASIVGMKPTE
jgi:hypothetical protein